MKFRITGQVLSGVAGKYPNDFIKYVEIDQVVEADDEYDALEKVPSAGPELYVCRDLVIQPIQALAVSSGLAA